MDALKPKKERFKRGVLRIKTDKAGNNTVLTKRVDPPCLGHGGARQPRSTVRTEPDQRGPSTEELAYLCRRVGRGYVLKLNSDLGYVADRKQDLPRHVREGTFILPIEALDDEQRLSRLFAQFEALQPND